ncbi:MAG TPA: ABC transporter substrate-binding protein, partial [Polyangiaceae bacterium]|nr:ABC transporter substrate-binding protein [Polyangiaceae bacterium]
MTETRSHDFAPTHGTHKPARVQPGFGRAARTLSAVLALFSLADCRPKSDDSGGGFPRAETFYEAGRQWGEPSSFNPLLANPDWPVGAMNLIYETLLMYNSLTGKMEPLLAESYQALDDSVEVTLNPAARWSDGQPVTAWDVTYTFELGQKYKSLNIAPIWQYLSSVKAYDENGKEAPSQPVPGTNYPRRVVFALSKEKRNPLVVLDALQAQRIVPRHVIEPMLLQLKGSLDEFNKLKFDQNVVSSGPYKLLSYSSEKIAAVRDDNYWGNRALYGGQKPVVKY